MQPQAHPLTPIRLTDLSRLPEIYRLRVAAWENSPGHPYVNAALFPDGWSDALDTHPGAVHWIVLDEASTIVAAARAVVLDTLDESGQPAFAAFELPAERPWGYLSRLVIAPAYRKRGLSEAFDQIRMAWLREAGVAFGLVSPIPQRLAPLLAQGWEFVGDIHYQLAENEGGDPGASLPVDTHLTLAAIPVPVCLLRISG